MTDDQDDAAVLGAIGDGKRYAADIQGALGWPSQGTRCRRLDNTLRRLRDAGKIRHSRDGWRERGAGAGRTSVVPITMTLPPAVAGVLRAQALLTGAPVSRLIEAAVRGTAPAPSSNMWVQADLLAAKLRRDGKPPAEIARAVENQMVAVVLGRDAE